jgi:hypothetical protein
VEGVPPAALLCVEKSPMRPDHSTCLGMVMARRPPPRCTHLLCPQPRVGPGKVYVLPCGIECSDASRSGDSRSVNLAAGGVSVAAVVQTMSGSGYAGS